ncbi:hypothetical protein GCM10027203_58330 [Nonomuraea fastidiosa]
MYADIGPTDRTPEHANTEHTGTGLRSTRTSGLPRVPGHDNAERTEAGLRSTPASGRPTGSRSTPTLSPQGGGAVRTTGVRARHASVSHAQRPRTPHPVAHRRSDVGARSVVRVPEDCGADAA